MRFIETPLKGAFIIDIEPHCDNRGFFSRFFCQKEFAKKGLETCIAQSNISYNASKGTLRGMHYQLPPKAEAKLVSCIRGKIVDVIIDMRPDSQTYCQWEAIELTALNHRAVYVPKGFAHGFQTLEDHSEVFYQMFEYYSAAHSAGVRWDDPVFGIIWPLANPVISDRDCCYPLYHKEVI